MFIKKYFLRNDIKRSKYFEYYLKGRFNALIQKNLSNKN